MLARAVARLAEESCGQYDFVKMQEEAKSNNPPQLDHATYIGPVEVRPSPGRGRGLFTTKPIKAGELLFCEKAFAHAVYTGDKFAPGAVLTSMSTKCTYLGTIPGLLDIVLQKLHRNPSLYGQVARLHGGCIAEPDAEPATLSPLILDNSPVIDTFFIQRIVGLNGMSCARFSSLHNRNDDGKVEVYGHVGESGMKTYRVASTGLWTFGSYMNHSCVPNARAASIGDMMTVRAARDMKAGTEITVSYAEAPVNSHDRQHCHKHWGFVCDCSYCLDLEAATMDMLVQRRDALARLVTLVQKTVAGEEAPTKEFESEVDRLLEEVEKGYEKSKPATEVPRFLVWHICFEIALYYHDLKMAQAGKYALVALKSLGFCIEAWDPTSATSQDTNKTLSIKQWGVALNDNVPESWIILRDSYYRLGEMDLARAAEGYTKTAYKIMFGENETFGTVN